jgi:uncharacterized repeat protein (TIGR03837 family)
MWFIVRGRLNNAAMDCTYSLQWDVFCRVIDNHGDLGVCLRLARHLDARGERVRLWIDDPAALKWMAVNDRERSWAHAWPGIEWHPPTPHQVVVEAFGCHLPESVEASLAVAPPQAWINLEYLSAEPWVERTHGLPSPVMSGPAKGLRKRFCYPGFGPKTGGLLTSMVGGAELASPRSTPIPSGDTDAPGSRQVSLFCYPHAPIGALFHRLADRPTQVWVAGGDASQRAALAAWETLDEAQRRRIRLTPLPWLDQHGYDALLQRCDLNVVRGEDSFVRAQWAGKPWLWHIYRQDDGSHGPKLEAFLDRWLEGLAPTASERWRTTWRAWNGLSAPEQLALNRDDGLEQDGASHALQWRQRLAGWPDLAATLMTWARENP